MNPPFLFRLSFLLLTLSSCGCFDLESSLHNQDTLTSYELPTGVIPASQRTHVMMTSQGRTIHGFFVKHPDSSETNVVLYNHGNRDHLQFYWPRVEYFYKMGLSVFVYDYQGYGMSEGEPSEEGVYSDAAAAHAYLASRGIADSSIAVYGFSLGGAPATHLAAKVFTPRALVLEAPFASASRLVGSAVLADLPSSYFMDGAYDNEGKIGSVHAPVLIMHGDADSFVDFESNGRVLYEKANDPKRLVVVPSADHNQVMERLGEGTYLNLVGTFVRTPLK